MLKHLLTAITILITLLLTAQPAAAITTPTAPKAPTYQGIWQKMTLKRLLQKQVSAAPSNTPTATPTPNVKAARTSRVTPTPTPKTGRVVKSRIQTPLKTTPTAKPTVKPTTAPVAAAPAATNDVTAYIMKEINDYRASQGLSSVQTSAETCDFAKTRAQEITTNFNHDGFNQRKESKTLPYTSWSAITENIAMTSNYKDVVTMWKNSSGHAANMRANTPYVCVMQSGNYYAYEGMKP